MQENVAENEKAPKPKVPSDFDSAEDFLNHVRQLYSDDTGADRENREEDDMDHAFVAGRQWDTRVYQRRINANKPALTINRLPAFIAQLVGNRRQNSTEIKVRPSYDANVEEARVREGLIRDIQHQSCAKRAYNTAYQNQVIGGIGYFQVALEYAYDDVWDQDIRIQQIHDTDAVAFDIGSFDPTGADARHVTVADYMTRTEYQKRYPNASTANFQSNFWGSFNRPNYMQGWYEKDRVRVVDFWRMRTRTRTLALMKDGDVQDVTDQPFEDWADEVRLDENSEPIVREKKVKYAEMYRCSGADILEGPYELPINRVPVFRVPGWEIFNGNYRTRFGLVRFLRDPIAF